MLCRKRIFPTLAVLFVFSAIPAASQHVSTAISDGCIATAGYELPEDPMFDVQVGNIEIDPPVQAFAIGPVVGALATSFAATFIEDLFDRSAKYIVSRAKEKVLHYDNVFPTWLYESGPAVPNFNTEKLDFAVRLNPRLRCFTVVLSKTIVSRQAHEIHSSDIEEVSRWRADWIHLGPTKGELLKRLRVAELVAADPNGAVIDPMMVFEAAIFFSPDGKAVQFIPRYFRAFRLADSGKVATRSVAVNITVDLPGQLVGANSSQLMQQNFSFGDVTVSHISDTQSVGGMSSEYGFGPTTVAALLSHQEWIKFTAATYTVPEYLKKHIVADEFAVESTMPLEPLNVRSKVIVTEKADDLAVLLSEFIDANTVTSTLSTALIQDFGLITDEAKKEQMIAKIEAEIVLYEHWRDVYADNNPDSETTTTIVASYQKKIDELNVVLGEIVEGCDPLGHTTSETCN